MAFSVPLQVRQSLSGVPISEEGAGLLVTDKGKTVSVPVISDPASPIDYTIVNGYIILVLITVG